MIKKIGWFRFCSASPAEHKSLLNLHGILLESAREIVDFVYGHYVSTEDDNSLPCYDPRLGENAFSMGFRLSDFQFATEPTTLPVYLERLHAAHFSQRFPVFGSAGYPRQMTVTLFIVLPLTPWGQRARAALAVASWKSGAAAVIYAPAIGVVDRRIA